MAVIKKITAKWRDWNSANNLPKEPMSVRCKMINGKEDVGFWNGKDFITIDPVCISRIILWKPLTPQ